MQERAARDEKKIDILQIEAVDLTRESLRTTQALEEQIDELRFENTQLQVVPRFDLSIVLPQSLKYCSVVWLCLYVSIMAGRGLRLA